jgi:hypothetical protein
MWVRGSQTSQPAEATRPWLDLGPSITASLGLLGPVRLVGSVGASFPLIRDRFQFDSNVFHTASPIAGSASLGLGVDIF